MKEKLNAVALTRASLQSATPITNSFVVTANQREEKIAESAYGYIRIGYSGRSVLRIPTSQGEDGLLDKCH